MQLFSKLDKNSCSLVYDCTSNKCIKIENAEFLLEPLFNDEHDDNDVVVVFIEKLLQQTDESFNIDVVNTNYYSKEDITKIYKIVNYFENKTSHASIYSGFEIYFLCVLAIDLYPFSKKKYNLVFDLVPGIGKTFFIKKLLRKYSSNNVLVCTPTAISAQLYETMRVRTLHSTFKIDPMLALSRVNIENPDKFKKYKALFFDEFSMIDHWLFTKIISSLPNSLFILMGDSSQLPPPRGKQIDFDSMRRIPYFKQFNTHKSCKIFRFDENDDSFFIQIIHGLKLLIKSPIKKKDYAIANDMFFNEWLKYFEMFSLSRHDSITLNSTIEHMITIQENNNNLRLQQQHQETKELFKKMPIIFSYKNAENFKIQDQVYAKLDNDNFRLCNIVSVNIESMKEEFCGNISNLFVHETTWSQTKSNIVKMLNATNQHVFSKSNRFLTCANIRCRKNMPKQRCINGDVGVLTGVNVTMHDCTFFRKTFDEFNKCAVTVINDNAKLNIEFVYVDLKTNGTKVHHTQWEQLCNCVGECISHDKNEYILPIYWQTFYSATMYNIQGQTIHIDDLFIDTSIAMQTNKLRCLYLLTTRIKNPKQIHIDYEFVVESLRAIYNTTKSTEKFKQKLIQVMQSSESIGITDIDRHRRKPFLEYLLLQKQKIN